MVGSLSDRLSLVIGRSCPKFSTRRRSRIALRRRRRRLLANRVALGNSTQRIRTLARNRQTSGSVTRLQLITAISANRRRLKRLPLRRRRWRRHRWPPRGRIRLGSGSVRCRRARGKRNRPRLRRVRGRVGIGAAFLGLRAGGRASRL